ncbi:hypothetical protein [Streptomyces oceani]|uniref:hypothetical protein n=1 Tax=Streptomyces oceani TaxID=1075402 RepID=UPI00087213EA|nr:hypothetical protein [Streptomyces oceani]
MRSDQSLWRTTAQEVGALSRNVRQGLSELSTAQRGLGADSIPVTGFSIGAAQRSTYTSWKRYVGLVSRECEELTGKLENAGNGHYANEQDTRRAFVTQQSASAQHGN